MCRRPYQYGSASLLTFSGVVAFARVLYCVRIVACFIKVSFMYVMPPDFGLCFITPRCCVAFRYTPASGTRRDVPPPRSSGDGTLYIYFVVHPRVICSTNNKRRLCRGSDVQTMSPTRRVT